MHQVRPIIFLKCERLSCALYLTCTTVVNDSSECGSRQKLTDCLVFIRVTQLVPLPSECCTEDVYDKVVIGYIYFASTIYGTSRQNGTK